jgi:(S)-mandelate dehydrogenase
VVKGLLHPDDAERAASLGVDAIVVSNHGGRQLDAAPATAAVLPGFAAAKLPVILDSGIRRGSDAVKAILMGAGAVMVGRAALYGLAVGGEQGVVDVIQLLQAEIDRTQALMGLSHLTKPGRYKDVASINPARLTNPGSSGSLTAIMSGSPPSGA